MNKAVYGLAIVLLLVVVSFVLFIVNKPLLEQPQSGTYYTKHRVVEPFSMTDHLGNDFNNESFLGKWSWIFLGYTSCPDICPTTLQTFNFAYQELQAIVPVNQVILISVDPSRDTQTRLSQYIDYFNSEFIALRAEHETLFPFARNIGLIYAISNEADFAVQSGQYLVDHSASLVLINPEGQIAATINPQLNEGQPPSINKATLVSDFKKIVALYQADK